MSISILIKISYLYLNKGLAFANPFLCNNLYAMHTMQLIY